MRTLLLRAAAPIFALALVLLLTSASVAQEPPPTNLPLIFGPEQLPDQSPKVPGADVAAVTAVAVDVSPLDQIHPQVAYNVATGEYFAAWEHQFGGTDYDIRASRLSAAGAPTGVTLTVANSGAPERNPVVAGDPASGMMLVVWESISATNQHSILAHLYNGAGLSMSSTEVVESNCSQDPTIDCKPALVWNADRSEYLVMWADDTDIDGMTIRARRLTSGAVPAAPEYVVHTGATLDEPALAYDAAHDGYAAVWQKYSTLGTGWDILGIRLASTGEPTGSLVTISDAAGDQIRPDVELNSIAGEFLVVWEDRQGGAVSPDIYARRLEWTGSTIGSEAQITPETSKPRYNPDVTFKSQANEYFVVYEYAYSSLDFDVYRQRLDATAAPSGSETPISNSSAHERRPAIASGTGKHYLVLWDDARTLGTTGLDIYSAPDASAVFSGKVYDGEMGSTTPLPGATVGLYASNDLGSLGTLIASTTSDGTGSWELVAYNCGCDMLHLSRSGPAGYIPVNADSTDGTVVNSSQIRYFWPLGSANLGGNIFWAKPQPPSDVEPPANWGNTTPTGWVNAQTANTSLQVEDHFSGLNPATAQVSRSTDGGATWSPWAAASCTGASGSNARETLSASIAFGQDSQSPNQNQVKFRVSDMAGNLGTSPAYPIRIDSVPPQNGAAPNCPSHTLSTWSTLEQLTCTWTAAADALSGIAGYSWTWSHDAATVPDIWADGAQLSVTSYALPEWKGWYFHLRAVDNAGNVAPALHKGPYWIDHTPPSSQVQPLSTTQWMTSFVVSWSGDAGYGSPIAGYDIKVVDPQASPPEKIWQNNTAATSATFVGQRGHRYQFYSRARDAAGNVEAWKGTPDRQVTVGGDVLVIVKLESGQLAAGAVVYRAGQKMGSTDGAGRLTMPNSLKQDELLALRLVYEHPAAKPLHSLGGSGNWDWRVYHTTFNFNGVGDPQVHTILDPDMAQTLTLLPQRPLIGFHLVVMVEWDASAAWLAGLEQGLRRSSAFTYDAGDGQFFLDTIEIFDNRERFNESDVHIYSMGNFRANAHTGGIRISNLGHIHLAREQSGGWTTGNGYRTLLHELGHYGLHLFDEYLDRSGQQPSTWLCAKNHLAVDESIRASIMNQEGSTTEFCSNVNAAHLHETNTQQDALNNGETSWETIARRYRDTQQPPRWQLWTPDQRGFILAGPNRLPMPGAVTVTIKDNVDGACEPFRVQFVKSGPNPSGVDSAIVVVDRPSGFDLRQSTTDANGVIAIYGARPGDAVIGWSPTAAINGTYAAKWVLTACPTGGGTSIIGGSIVPLHVGVSVKHTTGNAVRITVETLPVGTTVPSVEIQQHSAAAPVAVPMTFNAQEGKYVGDTSLTPNRAAGGVVRLAAQSTTGIELVVYQFFYVQELSPELFQANVFSPDGAFRAVLPTTLQGSPSVLSIVSQGATGVPAGMAPLSDAYEFTASPPLPPLAAPLPIHIAWSPEITAASPEAAPAIFRWDEASATWRVLPTTVNTELGLASAESMILGRFVLLVQGSPGTRWSYLPLVRK